MWQPGASERMLEGTGHWPHPKTADLGDNSLIFNYKIL